MGTHVRYRGGLPGRPGGSGGRGTNAMCSAAAEETAADLLGHVKPATRKCSGSGDRVAWAAIAWSLGLKEAEYSFGAISRPCRDDPSFGVAQRLRRTHSGIVLTPARFSP